MLDELSRAMKGARSAMVDTERLSDEQLRCLQKEFQRLREQYQQIEEVLEEEEVERGQ